MVGTKDNRRTQYTIHMLKKALLVILEKEPLAKITVTEICKKANINRGTFYLHFENPNDLFESIERDIATQIQPFPKVKLKDDLEQWGKRLISVIEDNKTAMKVILTSKREDKIIQQIFSEVHEIFMNDIAKQFKISDQTELEYYFTFFVSGSVSILEKWLEGEDNMNANKIADIIINPNFPNIMNPKNRD